MSFPSCVNPFEGVKAGQSCDLSLRSRLFPEIGVTDRPDAHSDVSRKQRYHPLCQPVL
jgi:hypothetical protein